jgi:hypothetical protein
MKALFNSAQFEAETGRTDECIPSVEEVYEALEQADEMNSNMRLYGTIDKPKSTQVEDESNSM